MEKQMENTIIKLFDINYDAPQEVIDELPKEFIVSAVYLGWEDGDDLTEIIEGLSADFISNQTDWLVNGFEYRILKETDFYQLKREFVWSSGDVDNAYNSYFEVMDYDIEDCDTDEVFSYLCSLDINPTLSDIALKYGNLWDTTQQEKYVDLGVIELTKELEQIWK